MTFTDDGTLALASLQSVLAGADARVAALQANISTLSDQVSTLTKQIAATPPPGRKILFWDDFTGTKVDPALWTPRNNTYNSNEDSYLLAANVTVANGQLTITGKNQPAGNRKFTSGYLDSKVSLPRYGRFEIACRLPKTKGAWPAFWLRPVDKTIGEIDIVEYWATRKPNQVTATIHYDYLPPEEQEGGNFVFPAGFDSTQTHVYALEWVKGEQRYYVDGSLFYTRNTKTTRWYAEAFDRDVQWNLRLNLQLGGSWEGTPDATTDWSQMHFDVDYVRVLSPLEG